jgi:hypothetical protein
VRRLIAALALVLAAVPATARASVQQDTTFQDDDNLVFANEQTAGQTLDTIKALGGDRIRISVFWSVVAPDAKSKTKPNFDATDPAAYPAGAWDRYDRLVRMAAARGLGVNFDLTGPSPLWATGNPDRSDIAATYNPSASEFGAFVTAVAKRYSGSYTPPPPSSSPPPSDGGGGGGPVPCPPVCTAHAAQASGPLPRVDYWAIWNEPNQPGWLTPQWTSDSTGWHEAAPRIYRGLADAAYGALAANGHGADTILVGETAPKGLLNLHGETRAIDPLRFVRDLYCVDRNVHPLQGAAATALGCPADAAGSSNFAAAHPALFAASGWAHHPYELLLSPHTQPRHRDWVTIANLPRLSSLLTRVLRRYGKPRPGGLPLYLTEYGYQTNPPDQTGVSWARQAAYLDESWFRAYVNPEVRTLSQFLLRDDGGDIGLTFQSGLETINGDRKPSYASFQLPVYLPRTSFTGRQTLRVWGMARSAPNGTAVPVAVEYHSRRSTKWRTLRTVTTEKGHGYLDTRVRFPGSGTMRLQWGDTVSREVSVRRTRPRG